jgi:hypothetical protein
MQTTRRVSGALTLLLAVLLALGGTADAKDSAPSTRTVLSKPHGGELLDEVDAVDKLGRAGDATLVELLDYYIGSGPTVLLDEAITRRGKRMIGPLSQARKRTPRCLQEFMASCLDRTPEMLRLRRERLGKLIEAIRHGKVLCAEDDNCPHNK